MRKANSMEAMPFKVLPPTGWKTISSLTTAVAKEMDGSMTMLTAAAALAVTSTLAWKHSSPYNPKIPLGISF